MHIRLIDFYWMPLILIAIVIFLINKRTRKVTLKILLGIAIMLFVLFIIFLLGMCFFKDNIVIFFVFSFFTSIIAFMFGYSMKFLVNTIYLQRFGCRTIGEIIYVGVGRGSHYKIKYHVNNEEYLCIGERLNNKWKVGDSVTVIYSQQKPNKSCLEKDDLKASIALTIFSLILLIGALVVECYALMAVSCHQIP